MATHRGRRGAHAARRDPPPPRLRRGLAEVRPDRARTKAEEGAPGPPPRGLCAVGWQYREYSTDEQRGVSERGPRRAWCARWGAEGMHRRPNAAVIRRRTT